MRSSRVSSAFFFLLSALVHGTHNLDYSDLQALDMVCPERDSCSGYRNDIDYLDRNCECDFACGTYRDCCIDSTRRRRSNGNRSTAGNGMVCIRYGEKPYAGVYAIAHCLSNWNGSPEVREKCEGSGEDFSDPLVAAPVTSVAQAVTYKNRYCAECNNAALSSLSVFQVLIGCEGLTDLSNEQILADITYNQTLNMWGMHRLNSFGNGTLFYGCDIAFDVPGYLNSSVRFCRSDLISSCPETWTRDYVRTACASYMAVVFGNETAYRNPHCAICNGEDLKALTCSAGVLSRKRPMSFALLLDVNQSDGDQVGMRRVTTPACAANQKYDPFFKKCRKLVCALDGHVIVDGKCVKGS